MQTDHVSRKPRRAVDPWLVGQSGYPADWPRCVSCGDFALDGHLTCGRVKCNEADARTKASRSE